MARPHAKHVRHAKHHRIRHSNVLMAWLAAQATRLSTTAVVIFNRLRDTDDTVEDINSLSGAYPANTVAPAITGTTTSGSTLTTTNGTWTGTATLTYARQWYRNGAAIAGAVNLTYVLTGADVGATITCIVTATNGLGSIAKVSNSVGPIT